MKERFRFKIDVCGKVFYYNGSIICEDDNFVSVQDRKIGLVRIAKNKIISQERCQE